MNKLLLFLLIVPALLPAQLFHATYRAELATQDGEYRSGSTSLYFNVDTSMFVYHSVPDENVFEVDGQVVNSVTGDKSGLPIITYRSSGKQVYKEPYFSRKTMSILEEPIPQIDWTIASETSKVGGMTRQQATGWYGNRKYEIVFTPDIPFPYGPHRLTGLPGLIISAKSTDGFVKFTLSGFEKMEADSRPEDLFVIGEGIKRSATEFEAFVVRGLLLDESTSTSEWRATSNSPDKNFTIEKGRWHIIADYKEKRGY